MSPEWFEIYRSYTTAELDAEITRLKTQATNLSAQTAGSQSYTADLREIRDRLQAAIRIRNEKGNGGSNPSVGQVDFSGGITR